MNELKIEHVGQIADLTQSKIENRKFKMPQFKVAVIGAGLAGLSCAKELVESGGQDVTVFEARDRLGGRAFSEIIGNRLTGKHVIERGGELVDENHVAIRSLARELSVELKDTYKNNQQYCNFGFYIDEKHISRQDLSRALKPFIDMLNRDIELISQDTPEGREHGRKLDQMTCAEYFRLVDLPDWAVKTLEAHIGGEWSPATTTSARIFIDYMGYENFTHENPNLGEEGFARYTFKNGVSELVQRLSEKVLSRESDNEGVGRIKTGHVLKSISNLNGKWSLEFEVAGAVVRREFDYIVVTVPFPVLNQIDLSRANLSEDRIEAIRSVELTTDGKVTILSKNSTGPHPDDSTIFRDNFGGAEESAVAGDNWLASRNNRPYDGYQYRVQYVGEIDAAIKNFGGKKKLLEATRHDMNKQFPGGDHTGPARVISWHDEKFSKGAYSAWPPGEMERLSNGLLVKSRKDPAGIYFAGEAQSIEFNGYMEGSVREGQMAACHIIGDILMKESGLRGNIAAD